VALVWIVSDRGNHNAGELVSHGSVGNGPVVSQNPPAGFRAAADSRVNIQSSCDDTSTIMSRE
jgi:hypothetical protein